MKWIYSFKHRTKAAFMLAIIIGIVAVKNIWDKNHVSQLGNSFSSVYEDRLLVESYIYSLSEQLYRKKIRLEDCHVQNKKVNSQSQNASILNLLSSYEKTKFTDEEHLYFAKLKAHILEIIKLEAKDEALSDNSRAELDKQFTEAINNLQQLSAIQIVEGKILSDNSRKIMASSAMLTQFELVILIVMGLVIQALVFTNNSFIPKTPQQHNLN